MQSLTLMHSFSTDISRHTQSSTFSSQSLHRSLRLNIISHYEVFTLGPLHIQPTSTLRLQHWQNLLHHYLSSDFLQLFVSIATHGIHAGYEGLYLRRIILIIFLCFVL